MLTWGRMGYNKVKMETKKKFYYTVAELAELLGISRISVFKRVRQGSIIGQKMGRNFIIFKKDVDLKKLSSIIKH
jgi:excisionase family DNA binding protein